MSTGTEVTPPTAAVAGHDFDALYREHRQAVVNYLSGRVRPSDVEDLTQEVFAKANRALAGFRGEASVRTWLLRIASRTAVDHARSRQSQEERRTGPLPETATDGGASARVPETLAVPAEAPGAVVRQEMHSCIREYVNRLAPAYREVIVLRDIEALSNEQVAARLGVGLDAAKIRLHRARRALRELLESNCELYTTESRGVGCDRLAPAATPAEEPTACCSAEHSGADCGRAVGFTSTSTSTPNP
jgi:RNA polymerase sigma-70 factor (ECF subfamily)